MRAAFRSNSLSLLLVLCALAVVSQLYLPLALLPQIAAAYQLTQPGLVVSLFGFAYAFGFLLFSPLSGRYGSVRVMQGGMLALTVISLCVYWVDNALGLFILRILQGLAASCFPPAAIAYLSTQGTPTQRRWNIAFLGTAFVSAALIGQIYGTLVPMWHGLFSTFVPLAAIYAITALALYRAQPTAHQHSASSGSYLAAYRPLPQLLVLPELRHLYVAALILLLGFVSFYMTIELRLNEAFQNLGISTFQVRAIAVPAFITPLLLALFQAKNGPAPFVVAGLGLSSISLVLCAIAVWCSAWYWLMGISVLFVAGIGMSIPSLINYLAIQAPAATRGLAMALYTFILFVGASLGPFLISLTKQWPVAWIYLALASCIGFAAYYVYHRHRLSLHPL